MMDSIGAKILYFREHRQLGIRHPSSTNLPPGGVGRLLVVRSALV